MSFFEKPWGSGGNRPAENAAKVTESPCCSTADCLQSRTQEPALLVDHWGGGGGRLKRERNSERDTERGERGWGREREKRERNRERA